ncbi:hypothetical protein C3495_06415 [Clostridiaceae bacterium 14S0207]|nr:hypothetical protein C3495_06415 [Clostridiaceae bacterium 14S0207]
MNNENLYKQFCSYMEIFEKLSSQDPDFLKDEIFGIRGEGLTRLQDMYKELVDSYEITKSFKGKILEKIAEFLMLQNRMYTVTSNLRDSCNEIDVLARMNDLGKIQTAILPEFLQKNKDIIIECKNYKSNIGVTWIGKFYCLLQQRDLKLGIIFSYFPLSGRGEWDSAKGLIKKIYLKDGIIILNVCKEDIQKIVDSKTNILKILNKKYNDLVYFTDVDKNKTKHPAM